MPGLPAEHQVKKRAALCKATQNLLLAVGRLPTMAISMLEKCNPCN